MVSNHQGLPFFFLQYVMGRHEANGNEGVIHCRPHLWDG